ncbi:MAG: 50S ribosomal protein L10 [Caldiserica bacterium]|nr:50S ribosomal protein L10 [Caldisericota bacterium]
MAVTKEKKSELLKGWKEKVSASEAMFVVSYQGLKAEELGQVRREVREAGGELQVIKNRLFKMALENEMGEPSGLAEFIEGPAGVVFAREDGLNVLKKLSTIKNEFPAFQIRGGMVEGTVFAADKVGYLASLPSKDVMLGRVLGGMQAPIFNLEYLLKSILSSFVILISNWKDRKREEEGNDQKGE